MNLHNAVRLEQFKENVKQERISSTKTLMLLTSTQSPDFATTLLIKTSDELKPISCRATQNNQ